MKLSKDTKAQTNTKEWLVGLILMGLLLIIVLSFLSHSGADTKKVMSRHTASLTNDLDNDGIADFSDDSPCITGEDTIIDQDGVTQFYFSDPVGGTCPTDTALVTDVNTGKRICVLPIKTCAKRLEAAYKELEG